MLVFVAEHYRLSRDTVRFVAMRLVVYTSRFTCYGTSVRLLLGDDWLLDCLRNYHWSRLESTGIGINSICILKEVLDMISLDICKCVTTLENDIPSKHRQTTILSGSSTHIRFRIVYRAGRRSVAIRGTKRSLAYSFLPFGFLAGLEIFQNIDLVL